MADGAARFRLDGQAAVITGASAGLGRMMAGALAEAGCALVLAARRGAELESVAAEIAAAGGRALAVPADVRDPGHAERLVGACLEAYGRLDGLVLNAGRQAIAPAEDEDAEAFADVLAVNVGAPARLAAAGARAMIGAGRGGWMIGMSSILAIRAGTGPGVAAYIASKGALESWVREAARQWARHGIRVNAIAPGFFPTAMNAPMVADPERLAALLGRTPLGRPGEPEDLAGVVVFLASPAARFLTGQTLRLDGGMSVW